jgi:hypothetical protein
MEKETCFARWAARIFNASEGVVWAGMISFLAIVSLPIFLWLFVDFHSAISGENPIDKFLTVFFMALLFTLLLLIVLALLLSVAFPFVWSGLLAILLAFDFVFRFFPSSPRSSPSAPPRYF